MPTQRTEYQSSNSVTIEQLVSKGYKRYESTLPKEGQKYTYHKRFKDENGVKYFITFDLYQMPSNAPFKYLLAPMVQFQNTRHDTVNVSFTHNKGVDDIENYVEELFKFYDKPYYEMF